MRSEQKYAVSNLEIMVDIMQRVNYNPNPVTICTLKNILKGRANPIPAVAPTINPIFHLSSINALCQILTMSLSS